SCCAPSSRYLVTLREPNASATPIPMPIVAPNNDDLLDGTPNPVSAGLGAGKTSVTVGAPPPCGSSVAQLGSSGVTPECTGIPSSSVQMCRSFPMHCGSSDSAVPTDGVGSGFGYTGFSMSRGLSSFGGVAEGVAEGVTDGVAVT